MEIYFSPLACSLAVRIACYEAGVSASFVEVDRKTKRTSAGHDFTAINPLGLVPTVRTDDGLVLTEGAAILQWLAEQYPAARLLPDSLRGRTAAREWLGFLSTELHKLVFSPQMDVGANEGARSYALQKADGRFTQLAQKLGDRPFALGDEFSVVDAFLVTLLNWTVVVPIDLTRWPSLVAYAERVKLRPSVERAYAEELALYLAALRRGA